MAYKLQKQNLMEIKLKELAKLVGGEVVGDAEVVIKGVASLEEAKEGDITFCVNHKYLPLLFKTRASAIIVDKNFPENGKPMIRADNPYSAVAKILNLLKEEKKEDQIHPTAVIGKNVEIGKGVSIGAYAVIEEGVRIGEKTVISAHTYIGKKAIIGKETFIHPRVTIGERVVIGNKVVIESGTVIGSEGFGYYEENNRYHKIPHLGTVIIEDEVEIGANVTIDRATLGKTWIKRGTKIDNLVQIAHNVTIGENCIIVAQVGISGSVKIGDGVILAGQVGVCDHLTIGEGVKVAARSVVTKDIPPHSFVSGYPARDHKEERKIKASLPRLPSLLKEIQEIKKKLNTL